MCGDWLPYLQPTSICFGIVFLVPWIRLQRTRTHWDIDGSNSSCWAENYKNVGITALLPLSLIYLIGTASSSSLPCILLIVYLRALSTHR